MNPSPTEIYTLSLHDALPIFPHLQPIATGDLLQFKATALAGLFEQGQHVLHYMAGWPLPFVEQLPQLLQRQWFTRCQDRKSTRLNSSHVRISYAVFCLKKKTT